MKKILIWLPEGRLGNLIFQYQAIRFLKEDAFVYALYSEFFEIFQTESDFIIITIPKFLRTKFTKFWLRFIKFLVKVRLIGVIKPTNVMVHGEMTEGDLILKTEGFFPNIYAIHGFFQDTRYANAKLLLKPNLISQGFNCLGYSDTHQPVAIHLRFGDYLQWNLFGITGGACLPVSYYNEAINLISKRIPNPYFFIFSDQPNYAKNYLGEVLKGHNYDFIEGYGAHEEFVMISLCSHAIISASTFAYWAAKLIKFESKIVIAPKYWIGFKVNNWYPPLIYDDEYEYLTVQ